MNFKHLVLTAIVGLFSITASAEVRGSEKATVIVDYFYAGDNVRRIDFQWIDMLRNDIIKELLNTGRVIVVDATSQANLNYMPRGYNENNMRNRLSTLRSNGGATYVVQGDVSWIDINRIGDSNSHGRHSKRSDDDVFDAHMGYNIRFIDIQTGEILGQTTADPKDGSVRTSDPAKSMSTITGRAASEIRRFLIDNVSITGQLLEVLQTKTSKHGEEAKTVAINLGSENGATGGVKFDVMIERNIAGHIVKDKIGKIKVTEVKGSDISYAEVKDGGIEILQALRSGNKLLIKSSKAGFWD